MSDSSSESDVGEPSRGKKRQRNPEKWLTSAAKEKRNTGKAYISRSTKKKVAARVIGPPCSDGCFDKVTLPVIKAIYKDFWDIASFNLQNVYIQKRVYKVEIKRRRKPTVPAAPGPRRRFNLQYTISYANTTYQVCKLGFLAMLGLKRRRVENAVAKVTTGSSIRDQRGKHTPGTKIRGVQAERVREHIRSFPTVSSHYTMAKSPHRRYMDSNLSIKRLHTMYQQWIDTEHPDEPKVKESYYRNVFNTEFNISFQPIKTDKWDPDNDLLDYDNHDYGQVVEAHEVADDPKAEDDPLAEDDPESEDDHKPQVNTAQGNGELESSCDGAEGPTKEEVESAAHDIDIVKEEIEDLEEEQWMNEPEEKEDDHSQMNTKKKKNFSPVKPSQHLEPSQPRKKIKMLSDDKFSTAPETLASSMTELCNQVTDVEQGDEFHQFGLTVAAQLRAMPLRAALEMQLEIQKIITAKRFQLMS